MLALLKIYLKDFKKETILGPFFKLIEALFELLVPLIMARMIDIGVRNRDIPFLIQNGLLILLLGILGLGCSLICQYFAARASQGVGTNLRNELFAHIQTLSGHEIDSLRTSSLITRLVNDVNQVQLSVAMLIRLALRAPFLILGASFLAMSIDLNLSLIFFAAIPVIAFVLFTVSGKSGPFYQSIQRKLDGISLIVQESLEGNRIIRAFSKQDKETERFDKSSLDLRDTSLRVNRITALLNPITYIVMNFAIIAILWFGALQVNLGLLSQGNVIAFVNYMTQIYLALVVVANLFVIFTKASASSKRILEVLKTVSSVKDNGTLKQGDDNAPLIQFDNVSFAYAKAQKQVLQDISFSICANQTVGIIGATGSGKSTIASLLLRYYDSSSGIIYVEGKPNQDYSLAALRSKIAFVPQQSVLFSMTIRENMTLQNENAAEEDIWKALTVAQASTFVKEMPKQLDSDILQGAKNLSGGQRQRLAIARALVSSSKLLILDDSTSALDFKTDSELRKALKKDSSGRASLLISQRYTTLQDADLILVLDEGQIVGSGTHDQLLSHCQVYQEIVQSQKSTQ